MYTFVRQQTTNQKDSGIVAVWNLILILGSILLSLQFIKLKHKQIL